MERFDGGRKTNVSRLDDQFILAETAFQFECNRKKYLWVLKSIVLGKSKKEKGHDEQKNNRGLMKVLLGGFK